MGSFWAIGKRPGDETDTHSRVSSGHRIAAFPDVMAEVSYYEADLTDALDQLNDTMGKLAKAPPAIKTEASAAATSLR